MGFIDIALYAVIALSSVWGLFKGFLSQAISLAFLVIAYFVAKHFAADLVPAGSTGIIDTAYYSVSFGGIFISVVLLGMVVNFIVRTLTNFTMFALFDKMFGGVFGLLRGILIDMVLVFIAQYTPLHGTSSWIASDLVPHLEKANNVIMRFIGEDIDIPNVPDVKKYIPKNINEVLPSDITKALK